MKNFYKKTNANVHRGIYDLSEKATLAYEQARTTVAKFLNAETNEIMLIRAKYCNDGTGYIDIDLYDSKDNYVESCKLKHPTDSCNLPFNLEVFEDPDCNCLPIN